MSSAQSLSLAKPLSFEESIIDPNTDTGLRIVLPERTKMNVNDLLKHRIVSAEKLEHFGVIIIENFLNTPDSFPKGCLEPLHDFDMPQPFHHDHAIWRGRGDFDILMFRPPIGVEPRSVVTEVMLKWQFVPILCEFLEENPRVLDMIIPVTYDHMQEEIHESVIDRNTDHLRLYTWETSANGDSYSKITNELTVTDLILDFHRNLREGSNWFLEFPDEAQDYLERTRRSSLKIDYTTFKDEDYLIFIDDKYAVHRRGELSPSREYILPDSYILNMPVKIIGDKFATARSNIKLGEHPNYIVPTIY